MYDTDGSQELAVLVLMGVLAFPLMMAGFSGDCASFFLILFIMVAGAWLLDMIIQWEKRPRHPARPTVKDIDRVVKKSQQQMTDASDSYLKDVRTITRR